jgi:mRNA interferase MazF
MTKNSRWDVYLVDLEPVKGSEQGGERPVLVISNDDFNEVMPVLTVIPITSLKSGRQIYPTEILLKKGIANLDLDSLVLTHQIRTISKKRIMSLVGSLSQRDKQIEIIEAIKLHLDF